MRTSGIVVVTCVALALGCGGGGGSGTMQDDDEPQRDAPGGSGSGGSGATADAPMGSDLATALATCVSETNHDRAMTGKPALVESAQLEAYAATGAMYDFSHDPHDHFSMTSGGGIAFAENECPQQGNWNLSFGNGDLTETVVACVAAFYAEGPGSDYNTHGHYINMMGGYGTLGCGIYLQGQQLTIVQDYGQ